MKDNEDIGQEEQEPKELDLAEQEFINYCEANEIDHEESDMDEEDLKDFLKIKKRFMKAVHDQRLTVDGTNLIYTVSRWSTKAAGQKLTIKRPIGRDILAMDGFKETQQANKLQAVIASVAGVEKSYIANLDLVDRNFLQNIAQLFLAE